MTSVEFQNAAFNHRNRVWLLLLFGHLFVATHREALFVCNVIFSLSNDLRTRVNFSRFSVLENRRENQGAIFLGLQTLAFPSCIAVRIGISGVLRGYFFPLFFCRFQVQCASKRFLAEEIRVLFSWFRNASFCSLHCHSLEQEIRHRIEAILPEDFKLCSKAGKLSALINRGLNVS